MSAMILKVLFFGSRRAQAKKKINKFLINPFLADSYVQDKVSQALPV